MGGVLKIEFPLSTLAHISAGYSAGSIKKTVENVLTDFRKSRVSLFLYLAFVDGVETLSFVGVYRALKLVRQHYGRLI